MVVYNKNLSHVENVVLNTIRTSRENIIMIPVDVFASLLYYSESIEDYETCSLLINLIDKVKLKTTLEFYDSYIKTSV